MEYIYIITMLLTLLIVKNISVFIHESGHAFYARKHKIDVNYFVCGNSSFTKFFSIKSNKNGNIKFINLLGLNGFILGDFKNLNKKVYRDISRGAVTFEFISFVLTFFIYLILETFFSKLSLNEEIYFLLNHISFFENNILAFLLFLLKFFLFLTALTLFLGIMINFVIPFFMVLILPQTNSFLSSLDGARFATTFVNEQEVYSLVETREDYEKILSFKRGLPVKYQNEYEVFVKKTFGYLEK